MIRFSATLYDINGRVILRLPATASKQLPTRGQTMVAGAMNGHAFRAPLEPDGSGSHWLQIDDSLPGGAQLAAGDTVKVELESIKDWPEPELPEDLRSAVHADKAAYAVWQQATPLAHWEWVRWTRSTNSSATRQKRIQVACSKLSSGERRPCCWNRNLCTVPEVSKSGVLIKLA